MLTCLIGLVWARCEYSTCLIGASDGNQILLRSSDTALVGQVSLVRGSAFTNDVHILSCRDFFLSSTEGALSPRLTRVSERDVPYDLVTVQASIFERGPDRESVRNCLVCEYVIFQSW